MIKKFLSVFLITLLLVFIYSYFQKKNPLINKTSDLQKTENLQLSPTVIPSESTKEPTTISQKIFLQVNEPKNNITVNNPIINISGKTISNAFIFINEQELKADINGSFSTATTLEEGENYILIVVSDDLGNSIEKDILVNLETTQ